MPDVDTPTFEVERMRSLNVLRATLKQVMERKPSAAAQLKLELDEAVAEENYELAAELRDRIRCIGTEDSE
jgi:excinuclease UvrABC nuclease subunit